VESEVSGWRRFDRPGFLLEFSYPDPTPNGQAVDRDDKSFLGYARVHLSSPDRRELYLEVVRFHDVTPRDEYRLHRRHLVQRFGADSIRLLTETSVGDWPARSYGFGWVEEGRSVERSVLLIQLGGETYRIIFDPSSELNARVIATLTKVE
jgi:hypothetical protein